MSEEQTTAVVQRYLDELAGDAPAEPIVRALLGPVGPPAPGALRQPAVPGLPTFEQPPVNLQPDELLAPWLNGCSRPCGPPVPRPCDEFFALANQHMRWELNDLARRLDNQPAAGELYEGIVLSPPSSVSRLTPDGLRMLQAIEDLPEDEREVFDLVRIQGMTQVEAAEVLGVSNKTVQRRLNRALLILSETLDDLRPGDD